MKKCTICQVHIPRKKLIKTLCGHYFCPDEIVNVTSCPNCRAPLCLTNSVAAICSVLALQSSSHMFRSYLHIDAKMHASLEAGDTTLVAWERVKSACEEKENSVNYRAYRRVFQRAEEQHARHYHMTLDTLNPTWFIMDGDFLTDRMIVTYAFLNMGTHCRFQRALVGHSNRWHCANLYSYIKHITTSGGLKPSDVVRFSSHLNDLVIRHSQAVEDLFLDQELHIHDHEIELQILKLTHSRELQSHAINVRACHQLAIAENTPFPLDIMQRTFDDDEQTERAVDMMADFTQILAFIVPF